MLRWGVQFGRRSLLFGILLFTMACGTKTVMMKVMRPAEINLKQYSKIALGDFVGPRGKVTRHALDIRDAFTEKLIASKRFDVVDRQTLGKIIQEQKLSISGLIDEQSAPQIGKLLGASALIFGRITADEYKEELEHGKPYKDKKGKTHQSHTRKGTYRLNVFVKIVDVQTGKIIFSRELKSQEQKSKYATDKTPPKIDKSTLYRKCISNLATQFRRLIAPYQIEVKAQFLVDDKIPETNRAVNLFKAGEWESGLKLLRQALKKPHLKDKLRAKLYYDLGLAQMYLGRHDRAIGNLRHALELMPSEGRYQKALQTAKIEKQKAEELKKQL